MKMTQKWPWHLGALLLGSVGCAGSGDLEVEIYGEDYIEQRIPTDAVEDGFEIKYDRFLIAMGGIELANDDGGKVGESLEQRVWDMTKPGPHRVASLSELPAERIESVRVTHGRAESATPGNATTEDVGLMNQRGYSVYVEGTVTGTTTSKQIRWGFETSTLFRDCVDAEGQLGVVITNGGSARMQLTIHGDHLFYDGLQNPDAKVRANAIVQADSNGDGEVTLEELGEVDLTRLPSDQYETGGDGSVTNLRDFVTALSRTLVHFQGEGECHAERI